MFDIIDSDHGVTIDQGVSAGTAVKCYVPRDARVRAYTLLYTLRQNRSISIAPGVRAVRVA